MEPSVNRVEALIAEKVLVFRELAALLEEEGESIKNIDVDALWAFSAKKEAAASRINSIRSEILGMLDLLCPDHAMALTAFSLERVIALLPGEVGRRLSNVSVSARLLREQVTAVARTNTRFVKEHLGVIDGMIATMVGEKDKAQGYDRSAVAPSAAMAASLRGAGASPGNGAVAPGGAGMAYGGGGYGATGAGTSRMFNTRA